MSQMESHEIACPKCGNEQKTTVWSSINVTLDANLKKMLFEAAINMFKCKKCGETAFINTPLLYNDMTQEFAVQYYPPSALEEQTFFQQFDSEGGIQLTGLPKKFAKSGHYLMRPHIVFDMAEMVRYVMFRDGLLTTTKSGQVPDQGGDASTGQGTERCR